MHKVVFMIAVALTLSACNAYNPVSGAAQDAHNEALKATYTPEGTLRP